MYVQMYMCICVCTYAHVFTGVYAWVGCVYGKLIVCIGISKQIKNHCTYIYINIYATCICVYTHTHILIHIHIYIYMYIYMYTFIYVHIYTHIHMYTIPRERLHCCQVLTSSTLQPSSFIFSPSLRPLLLKDPPQLPAPKPQDLRV